MHYPDIAITDDLVPVAAAPAFQHVVDTYASETNKVVAVWRGFADADLDYRPHPRSSPVGEILKHQLLSERRFFGESPGIAGTAGSRGPARAVDRGLGHRPAVRAGGAAARLSR